MTEKQLAINALRESIFDRLYSNMCTISVLSSFMEKDGLSDINPVDYLIMLNRVNHAHKHLMVAVEMCNDNIGIWKYSNKTVRDLYTENFDESIYSFDYISEKDFPALLNMESLPDSLSDFEPIMESALTKAQTVIEGRLPIVVAHMMKIKFRPEILSNSWIGSVVNHYKYLIKVDRDYFWDSSLNDTEFMDNIRQLTLDIYHGDGNKDGETKYDDLYNEFEGFNKMRDKSFVKKWMLDHLEDNPKKQKEFLDKWKTQVK